MNAASPFETHAPSALRADIQILRAIAILLVLWHHARLPGIPAGFLGVDMFFVISGYLMTGLIGQALDEHRFSFSTFYARRVRRLFPAAYATLTVTAILSPALLDSGEYQNFIKQLVGSFAFAANWVLWQQSDYFSTAAELKPLLHMWSLAVEEQFYLLLPVLMFFTPKRFRLAFVIGGAAVSGLMCVYCVQRAPSLAFYMLPTRAWELGTGGSIALALRAGLIVPRGMHGLRLSALAVLLGTPVVTGAGLHPGLPALLMCVATAVLVVPGTPRF